MPGQKAAPMKRMETRYIIQSLSAKISHSAKGGQQEVTDRQEDLWKCLKSMKGSRLIRRC